MFSKFRARVRQRVRDFLYPAERCAREGHELERVQARGYMTPEFFEPGGSVYRWHGVALSWVGSADRCRRCGHYAGVHPDDTRTLDGLTMDTERWEELRSRGFLVSR